MILIWYLMRFVRIKRCFTGFMCSSLHFSLFATRINAEHMPFALQLMDLWDNEHPKRMRQLHPGIRAWRVSRSSVSGVMENSKWNLIQYKMQGILAACCVFCLSFTVLWATGEMRVSAFGKEISPSALSPVLSPGEAGQQRQRWLWAALGGVRKLELLQLGAWGAGLSDGRGNDGQQDETDPADKGPALNSKAGSGKPRKILGCTSVYYIFITGSGIQMYLFLKNAPVWKNKKNSPIPPNLPQQSVQGSLTFIKRKLGELNAILLQIFKAKTESWWKSPVTRVCFRQPRAIGFPSGGENPPVISACLATQVGAVTSWFED